MVVDVDCCIGLFLATFLPYFLTTLAIDLIAHAILSYNPHAKPVYRGLWLVVLILVNLNLVMGVGDRWCPHCASNAAGCDFFGTGTCPAMADAAVNASIVAGVAAAVKKRLNLKTLLSGRYLKIFSGSAISTIERLARHPALGEAYEFDIDTPHREVLSGIGLNGYTKDNAVDRVGDLLDEHAGDAAKVAKLELLLKLIKAKKDVEDFQEADGNIGHVIFIWARLSQVVKAGGILHKVALSSGEEGAGVRGSMSATIARFDVSESWNCSEVMNYFYIFAYVFGVASPIVVGQFFQDCFYDVIRHHGYPVQVGYELIVILLNKVDESLGKLNLSNVCEKVHFNSAITQAVHNAQAFFPKLHVSGRLGVKEAAVEWNSRFTKGAKRACPCFNLNVAHNASVLRSDGTCMHDHICDKFVSNKGPGGRCGGNHARVKCDNPARCEEEQQ